MIAANSMADRLIEQVCQYGSGEHSISGGPAEKGYRVYHLPFDSCDSVLDGSLALSLSNHLRIIGPRMQGTLCVRFSSDNLFDPDRSRVRVEVYEVYATKEEAERRERELLKQRHLWIATMAHRVLVGVQEQGEERVVSMTTTLIPEPSVVI